MYSHGSYNLILTFKSLNLWKFKGFLCMILKIFIPVCMLHEANLLCTSFNKVFFNNPKFKLQSAPEKWRN